ncbi:hypothetical protein LEP3755_66900 (plasmid) [Leptolyngbya sp. NIES-3755]|nr:hypothetical protein LEP3755_66900 [Leptolyngbya sp. NIES-3755]
MLTLGELLATYDAYQQQRTIAMSDQLNRLRQQITSQLLTIRQEESKLIQAQQDCLDQMRPALATDARVLLKTPQFAAFIESLLEQTECDAISPPMTLRLALTPAFWLLNSVPTAIHLQEIEQIQFDTPDGADAGDAVIRMQVEVDGWQQPVHVSVHALDRWSERVAQIEQILTQLPQVDPCLDGGIARLKLVVVQELACLVLFVGQLFNLNVRVVHFQGFDL